MLSLRLSILSILLSTSLAVADTFVYVSVAAEKRIAVYLQSAPSGKLAHRLDIPVEGEPGALTTDPAHHHLFAAIRSAGRLASYRVDPSTGALTSLGTVPAGADPAYVATDRSGRYLLTAYYVAGKVTVHAINPDGALSQEPLQTIPTAEKAHAIVTDRTNQFAFVPHTGPNAIFQFRFAPATGQLSPNTPPRLQRPPSTGPRHLVFHPEKDVAYVSDEQGSSVSVYRLDPTSGVLDAVQTISTLPASYRGPNACAELKIHPSGKFVYGSNRGHDSIACFAVDPRQGTLTALGPVATEPTPRSFDLDPSGRFLYAAGESSGRIVAYQVDLNTGKLDHGETSEVGRQPWWVLAVPLK